MHSLFIYIHIITAPPQLHDFIYDCGVGEKTAMGFGCISRGKDEREVKKQFQQGVRIK